MSAASHRRRARQLREEAAAERGRARALDREAERLPHLLGRVYATFTPRVWAGPAASRAWDGYLDAHRRLHRVAGAVREEAAEARREATQLDEQARDHDLAAARIERAEAAAAAACPATAC